VNIENIKYSKKLTSIENETNVLKMSFREFPTSGQIFALMDMSFKDGLPDIKNLFTRQYLEYKEDKDFEINGITHSYNYQSVLSLILEKIFILLHTDDAMIAIKDKPDIINKFKATLQYTLQLYIAQPENTTEKISTEYSKLFNVDEKAIQEFINDVLYPGQLEQQKQQHQELERQEREQQKQQNRELESLIATLLNNIRTFQTKYENLFNNLSNNCPVNNVNATIDFSLTEMNKIPTLEEKKNYILNKLRTNVVENINKYLKNEKYLKNKKCLNYLEGNNINLKKVIHEWNDITDIYKYKSLSQGISSNSFQGMPSLRQPTYI
jgi:predicted ribosome quality control (RQC) complex YloA/Tae2 family protein